jgi:hypothetical protein
MFQGCGNITTLGVAWLCGAETTNFLRVVNGPGEGGPEKNGALPAAGFVDKEYRFDDTLFLSGLSRRRPLASGDQIIEELGGRIDARHQQEITGSRAGHVQQMAFRVVDLFQV